MPRVAPTNGRIRGPAYVFVGIRASCGRRAATLPARVRRPMPGSRQAREDAFLCSPMRECSALGLLGMAVLAQKALVDSVLEQIAQAALPPKRTPNGKRGPVAKIEYRQIALLRPVPA